MGNPIDFLGPIFGFITKGGEVLIGFGVMLLGVYLIAKDTGAGGNAINVIGKVPGIVGSCR